MNAHTPYCETCQDEPAFARCPDCGSMPLGLLHDLCREPLRQIASDMCRKRREQLTQTTVKHIGNGRYQVAAE